MDIQDIDENFRQNAAYDEENTTLYDCTQPPFSLRGVFFDKEADCFLRMPVEIANAVSVGVGWLNKNTSGGRVRFSTDSTNLTLIVQYEKLEGLWHMALTGCCGFALCEHEGEKEIFRSSLGPLWGDQTGYVRKVKLPQGMREYTLYFPLYQGIKRVYIGLDKGARVGEGKAYEAIPPILYYGSSITQGACATRPDTLYQGFICKRNNVDFINLGFSSGAKAEKVMIDYMAGIDCSVFVCDYDYNAETVEYLQETHYRAYAQYRAKRKTTPILFISRPNFPRDEETAIRAAIVRGTYEKAKEAGDENVYHIDGRTLLEKEWENCTVDGLHPTDLGFYQMSLKIGDKIDEILKNKKFI